MNMTKITKRIVSSIVLSAASISSAVMAMDLVMATDEENRSVLQTTIAMRTDNQWNVSAYDGSNLAMVDDIRARAVTSTLPNAAQIPGATIRRWAALGFINNLGASAYTGSWQTRLPKTIQEDISFRDNVFAVPTQIHRSNWMWMNDSVLHNGTQSINPPRTWASFFELLNNNATGRQANIITVNDPSQNALILEALILGLKGPEFYQKTFIEFDYTVLKSEDMVDVFRILEKLRPMLAQPTYDDWQSASQALLQGKGQILFAGDWIKPLFVDKDGTLPDSIVCEPLPEASATFLYNLNSVVLFKETNDKSSDELAQLLFTEQLLTDLNLREGSIPARLDISPWGFDRCAVRAMREFRSSHTINTLQPSLAAGMAAPEGVQKSVYEAVNAFITDNSMTAEEGTKSLAKAIRVAIYKI